jgi:hypothetical protein
MYPQGAIIDSSLGHEFDSVRDGAFIILNAGLWRRGVHFPEPPFGIALLNTLRTGQTIISKG